MRVLFLIFHKVSLEHFFTESIFIFFKALTDFFFPMRQVQSLEEDWTTGGLGSQSNSCPSGSQGLQALLETRGIPIVTFDDWLNIHAAELKLGSQKGKPQEKIVTKDGMLMIAGQVSSQTGR